MSVTEPIQPLIDTLKNKDLISFRSLMEGASTSLSDMKCDKGYTLLMYVIDYFDADIIKYLINSGADINARDADGHTIVYWAIITCKPEILNYVINLPRINISRDDVNSYNRIWFTFFDRIDTFRHKYSYVIKYNGHAVKDLEAVYSIKLEERISRLESVVAELEDKLIDELKYAAGCGEYFITGRQRFENRATAEQ